MRDVDSVILAAKPTYTTTLAVALEGAMLLDDAARARYFAIYGEEWQPLSDVFAAQTDALIAEMGALETVPANTNTRGRNDATGVL